MELKNKQPAQLDQPINQLTGPQQGGCPVCGAADVVGVIDILQVPIHCNLLWSSREEAIRAPRGDIELGFCQRCGHVFNRSFDPELMIYTQAYENSLHFSPRFQQYAESLAQQLIERYDLYAKDIIDIGCGKGDFLKLICRLGGNRGYGFDPSYVPEQDSETSAEAITFIQDFYSSQYAGYKADLICCRHVLEHIQFPREFLSDVYRSIDQHLKPVIFFEVPNVSYTLRDMGIWDLIYEHCSYFSASSLAYLFTSCDFRIANLEETYGGQFLCLEALLREKKDNSLNEVNVDPAMASLVAAFADKYRHKVETWQGKLQRLHDMGQRVVVWGGGSKGVTFLNILETQDQIEYVVDLNPRKQGMYVAGTGQKITPPEFLKTYQPDAILVMNPLYVNEIRQTVNSLSIQVDLYEV